jgi:hypothetical protein
MVQKIEKHLKQNKKKTQKKIKKERPPHGSLSPSV